MTQNFHRIEAEKSHAESKFWQQFNDRKTFFVNFADKKGCVRAGGGGGERDKHIFKCTFNVLKYISKKTLTTST